MDMYEALKKFLRDNGYDGLSGDECGCSIDFLAPCGKIDKDCVPAYCRMCDADCEFWSSCPVREFGVDCHVPAEAVEINTKNKRICREIIRVGTETLAQVRLKDCKNSTWKVVNK